MTNKEILHKAFIEANDACDIISDLRDKVEELFGEDSPIYRRLDAACDALNRTSEIHYEIQGNFYGHSVTAEDLFKWAETETSQEEIPENLF